MPLHLSIVNYNSPIVTVIFQEEQVYAKVTEHSVYQIKKINI